LRLISLLTAVPQPRHDKDLSTGQKLEKLAERGFDRSEKKTRQTLMAQINEIRAQLRPHMGWHGARLSFVALFLVALFGINLFH
jgi:hypothetical protein